MSRGGLRSPAAVLGAVALPLVLAGACAATSSRLSGAQGSGAGGRASTVGTGAGGRTSMSGTSGSAGGGGGAFDAGPSGDGGCHAGCSSDLHSIVDCEGNVLETCIGNEGCDLATLTCTDACQATVTNKLAVGCEYYATFMDQQEPVVCFAAYVANTWDGPVHIAVDFAGTSLPVADFAYIPSGAGPSLTLTPYDPVAGLPQGQVAILFLAGGGPYAATNQPTVACPPGVTSAVPEGAQLFDTSDIGNSFHITTDVPVVAYEINPYGGGAAGVTGASLLLPTSVWDVNYIAVTATPADLFGPSMNVIAAEDGTKVTMLPTVDVAGGGALPPGAANVPYTFTLDKGQQAQFSQMADLTGSVLLASKPIGFMAGQPCMRYPKGVAWCDHGEQMVPPVRALGHEYVGVQFRPRAPGDQASWHLVGVVDGTALTYASPTPPGAPPTLQAGQVVDFTTDVPFVVQSQDADHPFMLFTYMTGSQAPAIAVSGSTAGYGDPDFVLSVPPQQYGNAYVFFADPSYPETNLVVVRARDAAGNFDDVTLDCAGTLTGWQPIGDYSWTRVDLETADPQTGAFTGVGNCSTGAHRITSAGPFGLWVWGWGTPLTSMAAIYTANVSYGYPGGMNVTPINTLMIPPMPK